jgi:hypothetical protein
MLYVVDLVIWTLTEFQINVTRRHVGTIQFAQNKAAQ